MKVQPILLVMRPRSTLMRPLDCGANDAEANEIGQERLTLRTSDLYLPDPPTKLERVLPSLVFPGDRLAGDSRLDKEQKRPALVQARPTVVRRHFRLCLPQRYQRRRFDRPSGLLKQSTNTLFLYLGAGDGLRGVEKTPSEENLQQFDPQDQEKSAAIPLVCCFLRIRVQSVQTMPSI